MSTSFKFMCCIILFIQPVCHSKCLEYYVIMEKYIDFDANQFRPFPKGDSTWVVTDYSSNKTTDAFDLNCVIDLSCAGVLTNLLVTRKPISFTGTDSRSSYKATTTKYIPSETTLPAKFIEIATTEEIFNKTTQYILPETTDPVEHMTNTPTEKIKEKGKSGRYVMPSERTEATDANEDLSINFTTETISPTKENPTTINSITDITTTDETDEDFDEKSEKNKTQTEHDKNNSTNTGALRHNADAEKSKLLATQIAAGTLGTVTAGVVIFALRSLIQKILQSGVYRLPDP